MFWIGIFVGLLISAVAFGIWYSRELTNDIKILDGAVVALEVQEEIINTLKLKLDAK